MNFGVIKAAVASQFSKMQKHPMFRVDIDGDTLWQAYLAAFPVGSNPIYRERSEHDCSCCRHFVRSVGNVVAVVDGCLVSMWDGVLSDSAYAVVAAALSALVLSKPITEPFFHYERTAGTDKNFEMEEDGSVPVKTWTHFFVNIEPSFVRSKDAIAPRIGELRAAHDVFLRSLQEITADAIDTVLELIAQGSLYRGEEHKATVMQFKAARAKFFALPEGSARDIFAWTADTSGAVARIRNTVIGSLLVDLSEGAELEGAVRSFEAKVAPANYKRPSALVTKVMVEKAKEKLEELGLTSALERRYATLRDISVDNLIFADRSTRAAITGDVFDEMIATAPATIKNLDKVEQVSIERFIAEIVPRAESIEVMFENKHQGNLVSLIAPVDPTARQLFKWRNGFSWSYVGEVADSIRERVKKAGGSVSGDLCCRLAWRNFDDLDLHMKEPLSYEIFYGNRSVTSPSGGRLDVDMNAGRGETREPVENIFYAHRARMREGDYKLVVHQFSAREANDVGFEVEIDYLGMVHRFSYDKAVRQGEKIEVATLRYTHEGGMKIVNSLPSTQATRTILGLPTQSFHRVNAILLSPNHWDGAVGNKHYMFMLEGCRNDGTARGFFNEFLNEELTPHRKVFEVVGAKMKPADSAEQLSGLGFSSTQRDAVVCRVKGSFSRIIKVTF